MVFVFREENGVFRRRGTLEDESEENQTILMTRNLKQGLELCWICTHCCAMISAQKCMREIIVDLASHVLAELSTRSGWKNSSELLRMSWLTTFGVWKSVSAVRCCLSLLKVLSKFT